jgi:hypothetical protein
MILINIKSLAISLECFLTNVNIYNYDIYTTMNKILNDCYKFGKCIQVILNSYCFRNRSRLINTIC